MIPFLIIIGDLMLDDSLGDPYYRLFYVGWLPFLKIETVKGPFLEKQFRVQIEKLQEIPFMFFDRYEIHIQAFLLFINGKWIIFQSSSS